MVKKIIGLMIVVLLPISLVGCNKSEEVEMYNLLESSNCCPKVEQSSSYEDNITLSTAAYEEVITHFRTTDGKFTDDFGGVYVDENGLHNICVVGDRKPVTSDYIIYKQVDNAYNFLESIVGNLSIESKRFSIWMISICENCNIVLVCLEDERKISPLIEHLKSNNLFRKGTLNIFVGSNEIVLT